MLRQDQEVAIAIDERAVPHGRIGRIYMHSESLAERRLAAARKRLQPGNEVNFSVRGRHVEREPGELSGAKVDFGVERQEIRLELQRKSRQCAAWFTVSLQTHVLVVGQARETVVSH